MRRQRIGCNGLIVVAALAGMALNVGERNAAPHAMLYFTMQSNIWLMAICAVMLGCDLCGKKPARAVYVVKYMFTVSIVVTGIVYNFILAPQYALYYGSLLKAYSLSVALLHIVTPLLGFLSYVMLDEDPFRSRFNGYGLIMPFLYFVFIALLPLVSDGAYLFDGVGGVPSKFPYFFLDYMSNGWFTLTRDLTRLGTFYWFVFMVVFVQVIGWGIRYAQRKRRAR